MTLLAPRPSAVEAATGLERTFQTLTTSVNRHATGALVAALGSSQDAIVQQAVLALVRRSDEAGLLRVIERWHVLDERCRQIIAENPQRLEPALRSAALSTDSSLGRNGCQIIVRLAQYDLAPTLARVVEEGAAEASGRAADALLQLSERLCADLAAPRDYRDRRDLQRVRERLLHCLESLLTGFDRHRRLEVAQAFLMLASRQNAMLVTILNDPGEESHAEIVRLLATSPRPTILHLLLTFLEDPRAPRTVMDAISQRNDKAFVGQFLEQAQLSRCKATATNLRRITSFGWLDSGGVAVLRLDGAAQAAAACAIAGSGMSKQEILEVLDQVVRHGAPEGRRAAACALESFSGDQADRLIAQAVEDSDPQVQAIALRQIRQRRIPRAMAKLMDALDSPHQIVRSTAQECLPEINFRRLLAVFDTLSEEVRHNTGALVRKADPACVEQLLEELRSPMRTRRLRALELALALDAVGECEEELISLLLGDADHLARSEAARVLSCWDTPQTRQALREALLDDSPAVQAAAERALQDMTLVKPATPPSPVSAAQWEALQESWSAFAEEI